MSTDHKTSSGGLVSKEWIQEFHDNEGQGIDPCPLVEAAWLAHELLGVLIWLVGLKDERPADYEEQKPLAWAAARAAIAKAAGGLS
jgi:hypothetical protein